ncbi:hypothetical protein JCM16303_002594 [Sporobolomyces ruberrimus]
MPVPRAARLASRKSVIPDPSLYGDLSGDSDQAPSPPPVARSTIKTTTSNPSKGKAKAPATVKSISTHVNGKKKTSRNSTESVEDPQDSIKLSKPTSRPLNDTLGYNDRDDSTRNRQPASKRKRLDKASDEEVSDHHGEEDRNSQSTASKKPTKAKAPAKRTKTNQNTVDEAMDVTEPASQGSQASSQRKGHFVPRAATGQSTRPNKPPPQYSAVLDGSDDDTTFRFTTNPPTPHAQAAKKGEATKSTQVGKGKAPRIHSQDRAADSNQMIDDPPVASTSRTRLTPPPPDATNVAITTHETPVQMRNIAFRQGPGTPATGSKLARRNSNGSARRGSSIGGGFTATPHPEISNSELWRSTDPQLPVAARTRTILSWATQRDRTRLFEGKPLSRSEQVAKAAIDDFIEAICDSSIDTSVPFRENQRPNPAQLPPHPQNVANTAKKQELQTEFGAIAEEQTSRQTTTALYSDLANRRTGAREGSSISSLVRPVDPVSLVETFDLSRPGPTSLEDALDFGRLLLEDAESKQGGDETKKNDRRKSKAKEENGEEALDLQVRETLEGTAHLQQKIHRLGGLLRVTSQFVSHRSAQVHRALASHSLQGLESTTTTTSSGTSGSQDSNSQSVGAGLSGFVGISGSASSTGGGGLDPMDLLRAISRTDSPRK